MSDQSQNQHNQFPNFAGPNFFNGFDIFNQGSTNPIQPSFGQTWSGSPGWSTTPLANYNFNIPFQSGLAQNDGYFQTQQNDLTDNGGNDDFYESEKPKSSNIIEMSGDRSDRSTRLAWVPQTEAVTQLEQAIALSNRPTITSIPGMEAKPQTSSTTEPTSSVASAKNDPNNRAAELRARLLASKRVGSATPIPSTPPTKSIDAKTVGKAEQGNKQDANGIANGRAKGSKINTASSDVAQAAAQSVDKSSHHPPNVPKSSSTNADIEGLIGEYRVSEVVKDRSAPHSASVKEALPKPPLNTILNDASSASQITSDVVTKTKVLKNGPARRNESPASSESGEIRSDREHGIKASGRNLGSGATEAVHTSHGDGAGENVAQVGPNQQQTPKIQQVRGHTLGQRTVMPTSRKDSFLQGTERRKSSQNVSEPRNHSLAPRVDHDQKEANRSAYLRSAPGGNDQRRDSRQNYNDRNDQHQTSSSTMTDPGRSQQSSDSAAESSSKRDEHKQKSREEHTEISRRRPTEQTSSSSQLRIAPTHAENPCRELTTVRRDATLEETPAPETSASKQADRYGPNEGLGTASSHPGIYVLSQAQHEQIQKLGLDLSLEGLSDLHEFLQHHRFYIEEYREGFFARKKEKKALAARTLAIEHEEQLQYDQFNPLRAQSLAPRQLTEPPTPVRHEGVMKSLETPSVKAMPPPLTLPKKLDDGAKPFSSGGIANGVASAVSSTNPINGSSTPCGPSYYDFPTPKRQRLDDEADLGTSRKIARTDSDLRSNGRSQRGSPRTTGEDYTVRDRRYSSDYRPATYDTRGRSRSPNDRRKSPSPYRRASESGYPSWQDSWTYSSIRGQGRPRLSDDGLRRDPASSRCRNCDRMGHFATDCPDERKDSRGYYATSQDDAKDESVYHSHTNHPYARTGYRGRPRGGRAGHQNNKFRWNDENVAAAQRDCIWATQSKNLDTLTEAFNTCRNVILAFSVNNSRAFQGYARMQTLPSADIPAPSWQKALRWSTTDPFRIQWISITETRFNRIGHLKNALNEGEAVLVGRDGQEIEEGCGRKLCELIDEEARGQVRKVKGYREE
ncbi:MAG: hypothetical protein Q9181_005019 [Wetmoreana brouardii]